MNRLLGRCKEKRNTNLNANKRPTAALNNSVMWIIRWSASRCLRFGIASYRGQLTSCFYKRYVGRFHVKPVFSHTEITSVTSYNHRSIFRWTKKKKQLSFKYKHVSLVCVPGLVPAADWSISPNWPVGSVPNHRRRTPLINIIHQRLRALRVVCPTRTGNNIPYFSKKDIFTKRCIWCHRR